MKWQLLSETPNEDLVLLKFTTQEAQQKLNWEHSREFEFENKMYDLVRQSQVGDTLFYWCYEDQEETALNQQIKSLVNLSLANNQDYQNQQKNLLQWFELLYYSPSSINNTLAIILANEVHHNEYDIIYLSINLAPLLPPPQIQINQIQIA